MSNVKLSTAPFEKERARLREANFELAEALNALVDHFEPYVGDNECRPLENARAALAKAMGK